MSSVSMLLIFVISWFLLHFWIFPLTQQKWEKSTMRVKVTMAGVTAVIKKLRTLMLTGVIVLSLVMILIIICEKIGESAVYWPQEVIVHAKYLYVLIKTIAGGYNNFIGLLALVGAGLVLYFASRSAKKRVATFWAKRAQEELDKLLDNPSYLESFKNDPELYPKVKCILETISQIKILESMDQKDEVNIARLKIIVNASLSDLAIEIANKNLDFSSAQSHGEDASKYTLWQRFLHVLMSRQLGKDFQLISKPLGWVVTGLFIVSLIGWNSVPLANSMQLAINNIQVQIFEKNAQDNFNEIMSSVSSELIPDYTEDDDLSLQSAVNIITRTFIYEATRSPPIHASVSTVANNSKSEFVRAALNGQQIDKNKVHDSALLRNEIARIVKEGNVVGSSSTRDIIEVKVKKIIKKIYEQNPELLSKLVLRLESRYGEFLPALDAQSILFSRVLEEVSGGVNIDINSELGTQAQRFVKEFGRTAINTWLDASLKQYMVDILKGVAQPEVKSIINFELSQKTSRFWNAIKAEEGSDWLPSNKAHQEDIMNRKVVNHIIDKYNVIDVISEKGIKESMGGYDGLFPKKSGKDVSFRQKRAMDFNLSTRSFRTRGVVLGRELEGKIPEVVDMRWELIPGRDSEIASRLKIEIRVNDSEKMKSHWINIGSMERGVINQSLRYAADQRVVATTIIPGDGKFIKQLVYLHPNLIDTPLGCRIIHLDTFADTFPLHFKDKLNMVPPLTELLSDRLQMNRWLSVMELGGVIETEQKNKCEISRVDEILTKYNMGKIMFSTELKRRLDEFIAQVLKSPEGGNSFILSVNKCLYNSSGNLANCLCTQIGSKKFPQSYWYPVDHTSQVRERLVQGDANFDWLRPSDDHLSHLDFWTLTTFSWKDSFTGGFDESKTTAFDFPSAHIDALRNVIAKNIVDYIHTNLRSPSYDDFMAPVEDFIIMQSFARAALSGKLGAHFPMYRLVQLEKDTRSYVSTQPTMRWVANENNRMEFEALLQDADSQAIERYYAYQTDFKLRIDEKRAMCGSASK
ncbi:MAG: hypothetical protein WAK61_00355 [Leclercia sp.]